eukprot:963546-Amphidinium_carterae.1
MSLFHDLCDVLPRGVDFLGFFGTKDTACAVSGLWSCSLDGFLWLAVGQNILSSVIAVPFPLRSSLVPEDLEIACGFPCRYTLACLPTSARKLGSKLTLIRRALLLQ